MFAFIALNSLKIVENNEDVFRLKYPFDVRSGLTSRFAPPPTPSKALAVLYSHYHYFYSWALWHHDVNVLSLIMEVTEADCECAEHVVVESPESVVLLLECETRENNFYSMK